MSDDLCYLDATEIVARYADKSLSPVEMTEAVLDRIDALNPELNCFCVVDAERALAQALESEARWAKGAPAGLVDGIPVSIKDLVLAKGWPTLKGSRTIDPDQAWDEEIGRASCRERV